MREFDVGADLKLGVGGLYSHNFLPVALKAVYGGNPDGAMAFLRLKIG